MGQGLQFRGKGLDCSFNGKGKIGEYGHFTSLKKWDRKICACKRQNRLLSAVHFSKKENNHQNCRKKNTKIGNQPKGRKCGLMPGVTPAIDHMIICLYYGFLDLGQKKFFLMKLSKFK
jgi:hypothetical protein